MLEEAIKHNNQPNIDWRLCSDEDLDLSDEKINFAIAVRSFHWLHQDSFLPYLRKHMTEGGVISIIGDGSFWTGSEPWQQKTKEVIQDFLGPKRRAGRRKHYAAPKEPYEVVLKRNGFTDITSRSIPFTRRWSFESITGYLYSTSFSAYDLYDGRNKTFEDRLKKELLEINKGNPVFIEHANFFIQSGKLPN